MEVNGIKLSAYSTDADEARFELLETDVQEVASLDGQTLTVSDDEGHQIEVLAGYAVASIQVDGATVRMRAVRAVDEQTAEAIAGLQEGMKALSAEVSAVRDSVNPRINVLAEIVAPAIAGDIDDEQALEISGFFPDWAPGTAYAARQIVRHGGKLYRIAKAHTSQAEHEPGEGTESLYAAIEVAGDGIDVWKQPTGAHDAYGKGDRVHYPGEGGPVYESLIDANTWSPEAYPAGWSKVE